MLLVGWGLARVGAAWHQPQSFRKHMKPVKLSDLMEALEFDMPDHLSRVDVQEGRVVLVERSVLNAAEEGDEELLRRLPEWQKAEADIARAIAEDPGDRFVDAPDRFEFHEYHQMERFIRAVDDDEAAEQLWRAIKGKGAFRYFKDTAHRLGLLDDWFRYRANAMKEFVIAWAERNHVPFEDDVRNE